MRNAAWLIILVPPLIALGLVQGACGQIVPGKGGYLFRVKYKMGQVLRFETTARPANKGGGFSSLTFDAPMVLTVQSVAKGIATVQIVTGPIIVGHDKNSTIPAQTATLQLDDRDASAAGGPQVPSYPVKVGSTWEAVRPVNLPGGMTRFNAVYRFAGIKSVEGRRVAVITYYLTGAAQGSGTMLLLTSDASIYSNEQTIGIPGMAKIDRLHVLTKRRL